MDFEIKIGPRSEKITITRCEGDPEQYELVVEKGGESDKITVIRREPTRLIISIANKIYSVRQLSRISGHVEFILNGEKVVADLAAKKISEEIGSAIASVSEVVISNFPAKVVRVLVSKGSHASDGETLIVLEAMKMEAQIKAPRNCEVLETFVKEGEMVARGAKLARLKFT